MDGVDQCSFSDSACGGGGIFDPHTHRRLSERSVLNVSEGATQLALLCSCFVLVCSEAAGGVDLLLASPIIHHNKNAVGEEHFIRTPIERTNSAIRRGNCYDSWNMYRI